MDQRLQLLQLLGLKELQLAQAQGLITELQQRTNQLEAELARRSRRGRQAE